MPEEDDRVSTSTVGEFSVFDSREEADKNTKKADQALEEQ